MNEYVKAPETFDLIVESIILYFIMNFYFSYYCIFLLKNSAS